MNTPNPIRRTRALSLVTCCATALAIIGCSNVDGPGANTPGREARSTQPARGTPSTSGFAALAAASHTDDPSVFDGLDDAVAAAGKDPRKLAKVEADFVELLEARNTTPSARQALAQRLGKVLEIGGAKQSSPALQLLATMLLDETSVEDARLALEPVPGKRVDDIFIAALSQTSRRTRVAIMQSVGARRIEQAVPQVAGLVNHADPATAAMAVHALESIGGDAALAALEKAPGANTGAILDARLAAAMRAESSNAVRTFEAVLSSWSIAPEKRAIALRGMIQARPESAVNRIDEALRSDEPALQAVAVGSIRDLPASDTSARLAANLSNYTPSVRESVITALGHRGDPSAVPALTAALRDSDGSVRLAALEALGRLPGDVSTAAALAKTATGNGKEADAAAAALARLNGPGVDAFVQQQAKSGTPANRVVFIEQIAARNLTESIPMLLDMRNDAVATVRLEALDALRSIAPPKEQKAILDWALGARSGAERARAVRALIALTLRDDAVRTRGNTTFTAMKNGDNETRLALIPVLSRVGGDAARATAETIALTSQPHVADAAIAELLRWPDASAVETLVTIARKAADASIVKAASDGAVRLMERGEVEDRAEQCTHVSQLLTLPADFAGKNRLLALLRRCADNSAITLAERYLDDPATAAAARRTIETIRGNLAWPPNLRASSSNEDVARMADENRKTAWSSPGTPGEWISADLKRSRPISKVVLDQGNRGGDFPAQVELYLSETSTKPTNPVLIAPGAVGETALFLPPGLRGRYLWLEQTGSRNRPWTVAELVVE